MARRRDPREGKLRTREHVLADLSANYVEKQALLCGFTAERVRLDYGIDLYVQTFNRRGEVESSRILFQLKATDRLKTMATADGYSYRVERAHLLHWLEEYVPVVLVLYDAKADVGYWLYVQRSLAQRTEFDLAKAGQSVTLTIPRANGLDKKGMRELAGAKRKLAARIRGVIRHDLE